MYITKNGKGSAYSCPSFFSPLNGSTCSKQVIFQLCEQPSRKKQDQIKSELHSCGCWIFKAVFVSLASNHLKTKHLVSASVEDLCSHWRETGPSRRRCELFWCMWDEFLSACLLLLVELYFLVSPLLLDFAAFHTDTLTHLSSQPLECGRFSHRSLSRSLFFPIDHGEQP